MLSSLERLAGAVADERAAVKEAIEERDQARIQAAELRGTACRRASPDSAA
jgi:hypothetical protein